MIRAAGPEDAEAIARVHVTAWDETYRGLLPDELIDSFTVPLRTRRWRGILAQEVPGAQTFVAEVDGAIVGFASVLPQRAEALRPEGTGPVHEGEVAALYVLAACHRRGIGTALFGACLDALRAQGWGHATIEVHRGNAGAIAFYEAQGARFLEERDAAHLLYSMAL